MQELKKEEKEIRIKTILLIAGVPYAVEGTPEQIERFTESIERYLEG